MVNYLKIKTKDDCIIIVEKHIANMSLLFEKMYDNIDDCVNVSDLNIPKIPINRSILCKVIEFMEYHYKTPMEKIQKPLISNDFYKCGISKWDADYVNIDCDLLFDLASASEYLNIPDLTELICAKIASILMDKNIEEIQKCLDIDDATFNTLKCDDNWFKHDGDL